MIRLPDTLLDLRRRDLSIAGVLTLLVLAAYLRTLAPDVLYGDSAEFQTLAYTLGTTHSTGYPVYLLLARLVGFLPLRSPAWRINLFSALYAAFTVGGIYLLARYLRLSHPAAVLGALALALSYTFWSQAIIAEVYTPASAFLVAITGLLWYWQGATAQRRWALALATALTCLGLGVHASVVLLAPTALLFVLWTFKTHCAATWRRSLLSAALGFIVGLGLYLLAALALELHNPPSSFMRVTVYPSRTVWGLEATDLATPWQRLWVTLSGVQWQDAMFPAQLNFGEELGYYVQRLIEQEFSWLAILIALWGFNALWRQARELGAFVIVAYLSMLVFILNYQPPDKYVFFIPTYLYLCLALSGGMDRMFHLLAYRRKRRQRRWLRYLQPALIALATLLIIAPHAAPRWEALRAGKATFVTEDYVYPLYNLQEPRIRASAWLTLAPQDAVLVMSWRALYTTDYLAHVERQRPDILIYEASPHGAEGKVATSLVALLEEHISQGRPVFVDRVYENLREYFRLIPSMGGKWYRLVPPR